MAPPAGGGPGAGPRDPGLAGGTAGALLCGVGLDVGDLAKKWGNSTAATGLGSLCGSIWSPHAVFSGPSFSFMSLLASSFSFQGPHQASCCLHNYFRTHLTQRLKSLHHLCKGIAALDSFQGASQHKPQNSSCTGSRGQEEDSLSW